MQPIPIPAATEGIVYVYKGGDEGVAPPVPMGEVKPDYTRAAMRAIIQGSVRMECIAEPTGV